MVVLITNVTDAPGKSPSQVDIYNKTLAPGAQVKIPADLVTMKLRTLETRGLIVIGNLPPWYLTARRKNKPLSEAERQKRHVRPLLNIQNKNIDKKDKKQEAVEESTIKRG